MNFFSNWLFLISSFLVTTMCFWSCEEEEVSDGPSSVIISLPLNGTSQYDSGQITLRNIETLEKIVSDLILEEDSAFAVFETIADGGWDLEINLFHAGGTVEIDVIGIKDYILPVSKLIDWGRSSLFIYGNGYIPLNGPHNAGIVNWLEAYYQDVADPQLQFIQPTDPCLYNESVLYLNDQAPDSVFLIGFAFTPGPFDYGFYSAEWVEPPVDVANIEAANLQFNLKDPFDPFKGSPWEELGLAFDERADLNDYCDLSSFEYVVRSLHIDFDTTSSADPVVGFSCLWSNSPGEEGIPRFPVGN